MDCIYVWIHIHTHVFTCDIHSSSAVVHTTYIKHTNTYNIYISQVVPELEALTKTAVLQMESNFDHWERLGY